MKYFSLVTVVYITLFVLLCTALVLSIVWLWHEPSALLTALPAAAISLWLIFLVWRQAWPQKHQGKSVLLCRRFSTEDDETACRNQWIERVLLDACRDVAVVVTLRDVSIDASQSLKKTLSPLGKMVTLVLGGTAVATIAIVLTINFEWPTEIIVIITIISWFVMLFAMHWLEGWLIRVLGIANGAPAKVASALRRIINRRKTNTALMVVQSTDEEWRSHIGAILQEVSAVVVDATLGSDNLEWEINRSIEFLGPERVLFIRENKGEGPLSCRRHSAEGDESTAGAEPFVLQYGVAWNAGQVLDAGEPWIRTRAASYAIRSWIVEGRSTYSDVWAQHEFSSARGRLWAHRVYAFTAALCTAAITASVVNVNAYPRYSILVVVILSVFAGVAGGKWAQVIVSSQALMRAPMKAARRGSTVALATLWSILPVLALAWLVFGLSSKASIFTPAGETLLDMAGGIVTSLLFLGIPLSVVVSFAGALIGVGVEAVLFRGRGAGKP